MSENLRARGRKGEDAAVRFLENAGYTVVGRNVYAGGMEADILCTNEQYFCFVEVKTRRVDPGAASRPADAVDQRKRSHMQTMARAYIAAHPDINALVSTVKQDRNGDIIIVPCVRGHVINFGDTSLVEDKFARVKAFYHKVAPVCGWNTYDTVSVKWRGRITATHRNKDLGKSALLVTVEDFDDYDDLETMTGDDKVDTLMYVQPKP